VNSLARIGALVCGLALGYVGGGVVAAYDLPRFPACPTRADCWQAELICDRVPYHQRYACRMDILRRCTLRCERCRGGCT
jgi:hypothetical protein